jgi:hypothetical protein
MSKTVPEQPSSSAVSGLRARGASFVVIVVRSKHEAELSARQSCLQDPRSSYKMPLELQAPRTKETYHKKKGLQPPVQDSINVNPRPSKKRRRDETDTEIVATGDKNKRKRLKKEDKARQRALEQDTQPVSPVQGLGPATIGTLKREPKKSKKQNDPRKVEVLLAKVCLSKHSMKAAMSLISNVHSGDWT